MAKFKAPRFKDRQLGSGLSVSAILKRDGLKKKFDKLGRKVGGREVLGDIADTYLNYIHLRHISNANGSGRWANLSPRTIRDRQRKNREPYTGKLTSRLLDQGQLLGATAPNGRGQVRRLDVPKMQVNAGISGTTVYYDPRHKRKQASRSLGQLAKWAADGQPGGNKRKIVVVPDGRTKTVMKNRIKEWLKNL